jgi:hypothetical protein
MAPGGVVSVSVLKHVQYPVREFTIFFVIHLFSSFNRLKTGFTGGEGLAFLRRIRYNREREMRYPLRRAAENGRE